MKIIFPADLSFIYFLTADLNGVIPDLFPETFLKVLRECTVCTVTLWNAPWTLNLCYFFFFFFFFSMTLLLFFLSPSQLRSVSVDLNNDSSLLIDIPDALCERDKVKFTVHTKVSATELRYVAWYSPSAFVYSVCWQNRVSSQTTLSSFQKPEFSVPRQHEDFIWLHDTLVETEDYAGLIVSWILADRTLVSRQWLQLPTTICLCACRFFGGENNTMYTNDFFCSQIPPAPPKPDFESPREKMHKLGEGEATMTKDEYTKMKQELEAWVQH